MFHAGQSFLLNNRLWTLRQIRTLSGRKLEFELIGASDASMGMLRTVTAFLYGRDLFIEQRRGGFWYAHLTHDQTPGDFGPALNFQRATKLDVLATHTRHPAYGNLKNQFSWSYSRGQKYRRCPRAYYYHYYAAWEGWQKNAPEPVRQAYLLKNLTGISRWSGTRVHESIKFAVARLKSGHIVNMADLLAQMRRRARTDIDSSKSGQYKQQPNKRTGFQEHYYKEKLSPNAWPDALARAEQALEQFLNSPLYAGLRRLPATAFLNVEELQSFSLDGTKVWVQMDLAIHDKTGIRLYDWKTGRIDEAEVRQQLGIYGLYARHTWPEHRAALLRGIVFSLAENKLLEFNLDDAALEKTKATTRESINTLKKLLSGPTVDNLAKIRRFPMVDDLSVCKKCQFRALCYNNE